MAHIKPPFNHETALAKVKFGQDMWNTQDPERVAKGYTKNCVWRNRDSFVKGFQSPDFPYLLAGPDNLSRHR